MDVGEKQRFNGYITTSHIARTQIPGRHVFMTGKFTAFRIRYARAYESDKHNEYHENNVLLLLLLLLYNHTTTTNAIVQ